MPYADHEKPIEVKRAWRKKAMKAGYGKALYARRAARYRNEEILREAVEDALSMLTGRSPRGIEARNRLRKALADAPEIGPPSEYMPHPYEEIASGVE